MNKLIRELLKFVIIICFTIGGFLIFKNFYKHELDETKKVTLDSKTEALKTYLLTHQKPARVEIINLSKRFESDVLAIKKLKIAQDKNSDFYIMIQFFTDESDESAPLVAQVRFIETKSGNTIKEESLNLE